jgi:hypothetical protein
MARLQSAHLEAPQIPFLKISTTKAFYNLLELFSLDLNTLHCPPLVLLFHLTHYLA